MSIPARLAAAIEVRVGRFSGRFAGDARRWTSESSIYIRVVFRVELLVHFVDFDARCTSKPRTTTTTSRSRFSHTAAPQPNVRLLLQRALI